MRTPCLTIVLAVVLVACASVKETAPRTTCTGTDCAPPAVPATATPYLDHALDIIQFNSINKKRIDEFAKNRFEDIVEPFEALYQEHNRILKVSIVTAVPMDSELERKTKDAIERRTGKTAIIEKHIDPKIIGGMVMIAGGQIIDGSIRSQLAELQQNLLEARVN